MSTDKNAANTADFGTCAKCPFRNPERICDTPDGKAPPFCSTHKYADIIEKAREVYINDPQIRRIAHESAIQEASCYRPSDDDPKVNVTLKCRIQETIEFAQRMGYKRLGLAFCMGLSAEAAALAKILESHGFEVVSAACKVGGIEKSVIDVGPDDRVFPWRAHESMCNPVAQAMILNAEKTEFDLLLGLCVGHDTMFFKYAEAPVTVVAVKDRLLANNPLGAIYSNYYAHLLKRPK